MSERLAELLKLPRDTPLFMITVFANFRVPDFVGKFKLVVNT